ncbi:hypothetical protein G3I23_40660, partial [Streptomyces sp. SID10115]
DAVLDLAQAAVWGLARAARAENPGRVILVDTDTGTGADTGTEAATGGLDQGGLAAVLQSAAPELALRDGRLY